MVIGRVPMMRYMASKSPCWIRLDLRQRDLARLDGAGTDHLADGLDAVLGEEHMLGAAQTDALGAEIDRLLRIARVVGVGLNVQAGGPRRPSP